MRFLKFQDVSTKTGLSRSTIWRMERSGSFPRRKVVGKNSVRWLEAEIDEWMKARCADSATGTLSK